MKLVVSSETLGKKEEVTWDGKFDSAVQIIIDFAGASPVHNPPTEEYKSLFAAAAAAKISMIGSISFDGTLVDGRAIDLKVEKVAKKYAPSMLSALENLFNQVGN